MKDLIKIFEQSVELYDFYMENKKGKKKEYKEIAKLKERLPNLKKGMGAVMSAMGKYFKQDKGESKPLKD